MRLVGLLRRAGAKPHVRAVGGHAAGQKEGEHAERREGCCLDRVGLVPPLLLRLLRPRARAHRLPVLLLRRLHVRPAGRRCGLLGDGAVGGGPGLVEQAVRVAAGIWHPGGAVWGGRGAGRGTARRPLLPEDEALELPALDVGGVVLCLVLQGGPRDPVEGAPELPPHGVVGGHAARDEAKAVYAFGLGEPNGNGLQLQVGPDRTGVAVDQQVAVRGPQWGAHGGPRRADLPAVVREHDLGDLHDLLGAAHPEGLELVVREGRVLGPVPGCRC
mmetsp:Transcript_79960/g.208527  ORF Transcript_79960/g.208527 Transcript_79960/m.208527 type:complete len:273 (+) Transcript_79960:123-941(+)